MSALIVEEHWAKKGAVDLYVYRKRLAGPEPRPVLFLVHGSSFCARAGFDLTVPGRDDYSLMDTLAEAGFDVWTADHEGYGRSSRTAGNSDIASGVADLAAVAEVMERETGLARYAYYGASSGALRAAGFAAAYPDRVESLILDAFVWTGEGAPTLEKRRERLPEWRAHSTRKVDRAFFESIFTRDRPGLSEPEVPTALADYELQFGDTVPTGTYLDMCANLPTVDPADIACPVMIVRGEHDGIATEDDLLAFFRALPSRDKQFVILPGQAHVGHLGVNRHRFCHVILAFLGMPARLDAKV